MKKTHCTELAEALHASCVALDLARREALPEGSAAAALAKFEADEHPHWLDLVGRHVALAIAAVPESVLREWLLDPRVVGGVEIYQTLKVGAGMRATGKKVAA